MRTPRASWLKTTADLGISDSLCDVTATIARLALLASLSLAACSAPTATPRGGGQGTGGGQGSGGAPEGGAAASNGGNAGTATNPDGGATRHCINGVKDADETGVDCGGAECPSCTAQYKVNPPNNCENQFYPDGCVPGNASSTCGGVCQPRNACENDPSKTGPIGYVCSRYMLFSPEFAQASRDDAQANGWSSAFNYAVAGHDADPSGVDSGMAGTEACCECYQLVFDQPNSEYSSAAPPKPLIVQTFNTAAGGGQNFDLFMGAGGFGAFNACISGSSTALGFLYSAFPPDGEPGNGGIKVVNIDSCKDSSAFGEATPTSIGSSACQTTIAGKCNVAVGTTSDLLTTTTRTSCIDSNKPDSLYHLNWKVYAKRVACPDNLTRVTGCKLAPEAGLPAPNPNVTTAAQAAADSSFRPNYTTTTMQDCCKPTCAWANHVAGAGGGNIGGKNSVSPWTSFYTCDQNDVPMTQ